MACTENRLLLVTIIGNGVNLWNNLGHVGV